MEVLLVSADAVKTYSCISENTSDKYIYSAIKDAQEIELRSILGDELYNDILNQVNGNKITPEYKELLDGYIVPFLVRQVSSEVIIPVSYKIGNIGVAQTSDNNIASCDLKEISFVKQYYLDKANVAKKRLQDYLEIHFKPTGNTNSSSSCGIWLGGARGKISLGKSCSKTKCSCNQLTWICE